jgi:L-seryl-tRNA(Ser) seleniumtransferase
MTIVDRQNLYRQIPKVDQLLLRPAIADWIARTSHEFVVSEIQKLLQEFREAIRLEQAETAPEITLERLEILLAEKLQNRLLPGLRPVVNAAGVVLHTNLGRAPLSMAAQESLSAFSVNYTNLEYDISEGQRSHRDKLIQDLLQEVLQCEAATVVNNNAAAVFMILNTLASGKEVIVSRGELVEIGGSFRVPDIMAASGAILREVGTTNKTRAADYRKAITPNTALLLKVHPSNYRMHGFTEKPDLNELVQISRSSGIPLAEDIGSGCLVDLKPYGISDEPMVQESLAAGVDLICFSGDKLLGGPQAGIIAGSRKFVEPIRKNPLMRTYRVDKLIYGALQATLGSYRFGKAAQEVPVVRMIALSLLEIKRRAQSFARKLRSRLPEGSRVYLLNGDSVVGGGSCPECLLPTKLIALESDSVRPATIESRLRLQNPAVIIRIEDDRALIDLRTVFPAQEALLIEAVCRAVVPVASS